MRKEGLRFRKRPSVHKFDVSVQTKPDISLGTQFWVASTMKNPDQTCSILPFQRHFNFWFPGILSLAQNKHGPQQQQQVERPWIVASMMPPSRISTPPVWRMTRKKARRRWIGYSVIPFKFQRSVGNSIQIPFKAPIVWSFLMVKWQLLALSQNFGRRSHHFQWWLLSFFKFLMPFSTWQSYNDRFI